jgi:hypothetical protein
MHLTNQVNERLAVCVTIGAPEFLSAQFHNWLELPLVQFKQALD